MPLLRRAHDCHRGLRTRQHAKASAVTIAHTDQDRHVMTRPTVDCKGAPLYRWPLADIATACVDRQKSARTADFPATADDQWHVEAAGNRQARATSAPVTRIHSANSHSTSTGARLKTLSPLLHRDPRPATSCLGASPTPASPRAVDTAMPRVRETCTDGCFRQRHIRFSQLLTREQR